MDEEELAAGLGLLADDVKPDPDAALPMTTRAARRVPAYPLPHTNDSAAAEAVQGVHLISERT